MMSRNRTATRFIVGAVGLVGLLGLAACAGGGATLVDARPRLKVPTWAQAPAPLSERSAARLIYNYGARRSGEMPMERIPAEVDVVLGAFTRADAHEAVAAVRTGHLGRHAWQAWLLEWRETGWQAVRPIASNCNGKVEQARLERNGPSALIMRDSCMTFGRDEGLVRIIALGPKVDSDKVLFAAREWSDESGGVRHTVWMTGFDANGQAEVMDLAFTERRGQMRKWTKAVISSAVTTYKTGADDGLVAVVPTEDETSERIAVLPSY
jgi:hypothetical protein